MIGIDALAFVTPKGEALGAPRCGVTKITHPGRGQYLFDLVVRPGAKVQISALPKGYPHDWTQTEQGLLVRVYDQTGRPVDHGFALKIESPKAPSQPPVAAFATTVRGELAPTTDPPPSMREPILAMTEGQASEAKPADAKPADESEPDDDSSTTTSAPTTSSPKRKEESHGRRGR